MKGEVHVGSMRAALLTLLVFASSFLAVSSQPAACELNDPLRCWLRDLSFTIPDTRIEQTGLTVDITNTTCHSLYLADVSSSTTAFEGASINASANGLGITCRGNWSITIDYAPLNLITIPGQVYIVLDNTNTTQSISTKYNSTTRMADSAHLDACFVAINISYIEFEGETGPFLNTFRGVLVPFLEFNANKTVCDQLDKYIGNDTTTILHDLAQQMQNYTDTKPDNITVISQYDFVDVRKHSFVNVTDYVLNELIGTKGVINIDLIMNKLTRGTGRFDMSEGIPTYVKENFGFNIPDPKFDITIPNYGQLTLSIDGADVRGVDTWKSFDLLVPTGPQILDSSFGLGQFSVRVNFSVVVDLHGQASDSVLRESGSIYLSLSSVQLNSSMFLGIDSDINSIRSNQFTDPQCLVSEIRVFNMTGLVLDFDMKEMSLTPTPSTTGPLAHDLDKLVSDASAFIVGSVGPAIPVLIYNAAIQPGRHTLNEKLMGILTEERQCPTYEDPNDGTINGRATGISIGAVLGIFLAICVIAAIYLRSERNKSYTPEESRLISEYLEGVDVLPTGATSLFLDPSIGITIRYGVALVTLFNMALFVSSNSSVGASVYVFLSTPDTRIQLPSTFNFGLENSVKDMWKAGVYPLSILIAVFSGLWPYVKLTLMLVCWVIPPRFIPLKHRGRILTVLDVMGKWSLIDAYVLIIMMVAFHFHIQPPAPLIVDAYVQPHWGFYCFLLATMLSLIITHIVIHYHRKSKELGTTHFKLNDDGEVRIVEEKNSLCNLAIEGKTEKRAKLLKFGLTAAVLLAFVLVIVGVVVTSFSFKFKGAFELLLIFLDEPTERSFSLITLGGALASAALEPNSIGTRFIQVTFFVFGLIMPLSYMISILVLWLVPLKQRVQHKIMVATEIFNAWSALEVFVVSIIAALFQLQQFAQFMIGDMCDQINPLLEKYVGKEAMRGDTKCFDVVATLESGCWILFVSCAIYLIMGSVLMRFCNRILEKEDRSDSGVSTDSVIN